MPPLSCRSRNHRGLLALALLLAASSALPQALSGRSQPPAARADPLDVQAHVPAAIHQSSLARYRRLGDAPDLPWKAANETVNRIGGWRAYARQAQQVDASASAASAARAPASGASATHRGHPPH